MPRNLDKIKMQVMATLLAHRMAEKDDRILVAVSGGADSVALLLVLRELGFTVEAAHLDHMTREGESGEDARFVMDLCSKLDLTLHAEQLDVAAMAADTSKSFEEYARELRYAFLCRVARERKCPVIATGHHADDQAETVLMRVLRGTSPSGLAGIPPIRHEEELRIIRPLLDCRRVEIEAWLREKAVRWRKDSSNDDTAYRRNQVRHQLLPQLERNYNPKLRDALIRLADAQRCESELLHTLTRQAKANSVAANNTIDRGKFARLHPALQRRVLLELFYDQALDLPFERIVEATRFVLEGKTGQLFDLNGGLSLENTQEHTQFAAEKKDKPAGEIQLRIPGETEAFGYRFHAQLLMHLPLDLAAHCSPSCQLFDAEVFAEGATVRMRRDGDRFTPMGMDGTKKLKDYFIDIGLPASERDHTPLIIASERIAWVVGQACGAHAAVMPLTRRILEIKVAPCE